jgi:2-polyprenyl-6-methoxyphenol hydroxylase-like FAD-dependent oxidoreductase
MKAIIIGGGIGGLSVAIALNRAGVETAVFEQAKRLREVGSGVTLWSNAVAMGAANGLRKRGSVEAQFEVRNWRRSVLAVTPFAALERKLGAKVNIGSIAESYWSNSPASCPRTASTAAPDV